MDRELLVEGNRGLTAPESTPAWEGGELDRWERDTLRRVGGLSTELEDVTEVENRSLRLEYVVLVGVYSPGDAEGAENSLKELAALAETAGSTVLDGVIQKRITPDPSTYIGSGKAQELAALVADLRADTVIVDTELAPSQRRALEDVIKVKVIDRVALILDIFAQHAKSREGKAQVELAQLDYLLPRLRGWGESMSRQAGGRVSGGEGIGSRGPGETKIELDRRRIRARMAKLRKSIAAMEPARETKRADRQRNKVLSVAIVGYTNAGKSSLLNRITNADVMVENALFATLDPTVRKAVTTDGRIFTCTDTVGFVRNLPHQLVEAFRSTLEEAVLADIRLLVVDATHSEPAEHLMTVRKVLDEALGESDTGVELVVFNKVDALAEEAYLGLRQQYPEAVFVSAATGWGLDSLHEKIAELLPVPECQGRVLIPFHRGDLVARVHEEGTVEAETYHASGTELRVRVHPELWAKLEPFTCSDESVTSLTENSHEQQG